LEQSKLDEIFYHKKRESHNSSLSTCTHWLQIVFLEVMLNRVISPVSSIKLNCVSE